MLIYDQRKPLTCNFNELEQGDLFAYEEDGEDLFYLMVIGSENVPDDCGKAVVLGSNRDGYLFYEGSVWTFKSDDEVQPLKGDLKVWAK